MVESPLITDLNSTLGLVAKIIEVCGVVVILVGGVAVTIKYLRQLKANADRAYERYRAGLGKAILLGLEILVAGDIIGTVAIEPTFNSLAVLGLIVLIRTFLSFSLEVEIEGRWPWQGNKKATP